MLGQTTSSSTPASASAPAPMRDVQAEALRALEAIEASPEFRTLGDSFDEPDPMHTPLFGDLDDPLFGGSELESPFLTSPMGSMLSDFNTSPLDTPFSDFLATPVMDLHDTFTHSGGGDSPVITDRGFEDDRPLFGAASAFPTFETVSPPSVNAAMPKVGKDKLWTFSPSSPMLDTMPPPADVPAPAPMTTKSRRRTGVTGTRKNITPAALIPLDAPTQKRTYVTPSATSRKAVPAAFRSVTAPAAAASTGSKRAHADAFDDELPELPPTATEAELIEYKRRQNTLAARKSRKRKLEYQQNLEDELEDLRGQVTMWRERALMAQEMLRSTGLTFSFDNVEKK